MTSHAVSSGLHSVDDTNASSVRLQFLDLEGAKPAMRLAKQRSIELLALRTGAHVLEVGCGTGDDARVLVGLVGENGRIVGLDVDPVMIAEAEKRAAPLPAALQFCVGDVYELDFADAAFDACRADRTFLHLEKPERALAQMARVVRAGGAIVVLDRDIETRTIDAPDRALTRRIVNFWCDTFLGGWVGRKLPRLFRDAGLTAITIDAFTVVDTDYATFNAQYNLPRVAARAAAAGVISVEESHRWVSDLQSMAQDGSFFTSVTNVVVSGRKG